MEMKVFNNSCIMNLDNLRIGFSIKSRAVKPKEKSIQKLYRRCNLETEVGDDETKSL